VNFVTVAYNLSAEQSGASRLTCLIDCGSVTRRRRTETNAVDVGGQCSRHPHYRSTSEPHIDTLVECTCIMMYM